MEITMKAVRQFATAGLFVLIAGFSSQSLAGDCIDSGGKSTCQPPTPSEWRYTLCDDAGAYLNRQIAWCIVFGGTWISGGCQNPTTSVTEGNAAGLAGQFEELIHGASTCPPGPPPGACSNWNCACTQSYTNGVLTYDYSTIPFSGGRLDPVYGTCATWAENVILGMYRGAPCPTGWSTGGELGKPCRKEKAPPCDTRGNPVCAADGSKSQREYDYVSPAPGGLSFARLYTNTGFFDLVPRTVTPADYWRHTYSSRVIPYVGNAFVMAMVQHADGTLRPFNHSEAEIQNGDGAAYRLQKLVDGGGSITGWRLTTGDSDVETYDAQGRLVSIATRAGFTTTLVYNGSGQLATVSDAFSRSITFTYDASGRLATMTDPASRVYQYGYDAKGMTSTVTYPDATVRTYLYEDSTNPFLLTGIVDERGVRLSTYAYDATGRAISTEHAGQTNKFTFSFQDGVNPTGTVRDGFGTYHTYTYSKVAGVLKRISLGNSVTGTENWTYDANGNPATYRDRRQTLTTYTFDARNLEVSRTEASGTSLARTIATTWHPTFRLPATITEPSGVAGVNLVTTFTYDPAGNLSRKNLTAGSNVREWNYTYNTRGQVLTIDGPRTDATDVTTITYYGDADSCVGCRGQVQTMTNALGHVTTFNAYAADGRPSQVTDANGVVTTLTYKTRGWLESRSVGGETTTYDYDPIGNLVKVTMPDGSWVSYTYDGAAQLVGIDDSIGNAIDYELDVMGNRVREDVIDPQGQLRRTLQRLYDGANRLQKELGAAAQTTTYTRDGNGNVSSVSDPLYRVTTNTYDALNRPTNINDATNGNTVFTYDAKDRLQTVKDPKLSALTTYTYDSLGNLTSQVSPDTGTTSFTYDAAGNVATQTDARNVVTTYTYDALNRVTSATVADGTVTYEYDNLVTGGAYAKGRLTKVTDPSGFTTYVYDALGRVTSKVQTTNASPANKTFTVGYGFASGRQTGVTYPSGRAATYGFNAQGQVTSIAVDGASVLSGGEYFPYGPVKKWTWANGQAMERTYDLDGRVKVVTLGPATATYPDLSQVFGYDSLNRLTSANLAAGQTQSFTYDANGNRTNATINAASTTYTYPTSSHKLASLSGATTRSFTYDNGGNVTLSAGITYVYDGRGRMKQAGTTTYLVNGLGQRVKKATGVAETYFAYDEAGRLIGEYDTSGAAIQETVWLGDLPVAVIKPATPPAFDLFYIWADHLGTPRQITDAANQSRWEWNHNDPFGNNPPNENPAGVGVFAYNLRFPGQYYDAETGTHYNYYRDYDASLGRYIESDPIGLRAGINTYSYVDSNPLADSDRSGLWKDSIENWRKPPGFPDMSADARDRAARQLSELWRSFGKGDEEKGCCPACPAPPPPRIDRVPPSRPHYPCPGDHWSYFEYHQAPYPTCTCRLVQRFGGCLSQGGHPPGWKNGNPPSNPPVAPDRDW